MDKTIPEDIKQFILQYIDSIAQMEGLLLLCSDPQQQWNAEELARALFISESQATAILSQLFEQGFITSAQSNFPSYYRYQPASVSLKDMLERVAVFYKQYLIPVTNLIHSKPKSRIQEFADAFKLRKD